MRGNVDAKIIRNTVTGTASALSPGTASSSGPMYRRGTADTDTATAEVWGNVVSGNVYTTARTPPGSSSWGHATVNMSKKNTVTGNDANI